MFRQQLKLDDLNFIDYYESKLKEYELLTILKNELTEKGLKIYFRIDKYLKENLAEYLEKTGNVYV
jgi:membrane peptidoglycan carboxypeptidase